MLIILKKTKETLKEIEENENNIDKDDYSVNIVGN
jgi:hypothetical protein